MSVKSVISIPLRLIKLIYYKLSLGNFGWNSNIIYPLKIQGRKNVHVGHHVSIHYKTWLAALPLTGADKCELIIDDGCTIGHFNHFIATRKVHLHRGVLTADKVYISDNIHGYENTELYIMNQPIIQRNCVEIGEGSWLGENVCVIGASVGKHCVIGANSVVTKDIPDYSVAVGSPANVIKKYDLNLKMWVKV